MDELDRLEGLLDSALEATFPASDPVALFAVADGYAELRGAREPAPRASRESGA
jgi:hypothetical protein